MKLHNKALEDLHKQDEKWPDRHKVMHKGCCKLCPADMMRKHGVEDPESKDIKDHCSKERVASEFLFVCAWRPNKLCKGVCDYHGINQEFLDKVHK